MRGGRSRYGSGLPVVRRGSMARVLTAPAVRPGLNSTLLAWGALTFLGAVSLPWARPGRELFTFSPEATGAALARTSPLMGAILLTALLVAAAGLVPWATASRGRAAIVLGALGTVLVAVRLFGTGQPFSWGVAAAALGFLAVLGTGLALAGVLRTDAFIAGSILWVAVFVAIFILYPLWTVLEASVVVRGRFTFDVVRETLRSPAFFLLNNPATPRNETAVALTAGGIVTAVGPLLPAV